MKNTESSEYPIDLIDVVKQIKRSAAKIEEILLEQGNPKKGETVDPKQNLRDGLLTIGRKVYEIERLLTSRNGGP